MITVVNSSYWNAFLLAAKYRRLEILKLMLEGEESKEDTQNSYSWKQQAYEAMYQVTRQGYNILHICSKTGDIAVLTYLLQKIKHSSQIANKNAGDLMTRPLNKMLESTCKNKLTPFLLAVICNNLRAVHQLIVYGCDIYAKNNKLQNALHLAVIAGNVEMIKFIVKIDADKNILRNQPDISRHKPIELYAARKFKNVFYHIWDHAQNGNIELLDQELADGNYEINEKTHIKQNTPLHIAIKFCQHKMIEHLAKRKADFLVVNAKGLSPLDILKKTKDLYFREKVERSLGNKSFSLHNDSPQNKNFKETKANSSLRPCHKRAKSKSKICINSLSTSLLPKLKTSCLTFIKDFMVYI